MSCKHRRQSLLLSTYLVLSMMMLILSHTSASTTNFCGTSWEDASTDCSNKKPCPLGTDEECEIGTCWGDTACDTTTGGGLVFDKENPKHSRFCGVGWNEAKDNCNPATHCPSGSKDECEDGEQCYSFLSGCNFVDMMTGGEQNQSTNKPKLPTLDPEDPARSNYCGSSFADAENSCFEDDHWCPSGGDGDCPSGKLCFASTSCKFVADLEPSRAPIPAPSADPTQAPLIHDMIENTRFCGVGWDDASNTCRIESHCPSGLSSDCPVGQNCYGWILGCNIVDLREHLLATGTQVFGKDRLPLSEGDGGFELQTVTRSPAEAPHFSSSPVTTDDVVNLIPENHVFCGYTFQDASSKCSIATFCSDGVDHKCPSGEHCWSGVTACNAGEWRAPMTVSPIRQPSVSLTPVPIFNSTQQPTAIDLIVTTAEPAVSTATDPPSSFLVVTSSDNAEIITVSFSPSPQTTSFVTLPSVSSSAAVSLPPSDSPSHSSAAMSVSSSPTNTPTKYSLTKDEIANRLTNYNNYCAKSQAEVLEQCSFTLKTCNDLMMICPVGTFCFYNIMCPDPKTSSPTRQQSLRPLTNSPTQQLQNYCAESSLDLLATCDTSPTCNEGDDPCPANTMCFKEIICDAIQNVPAQEKETTKPTLEPSSLTSDETLKPVLLAENPFECTGLCLMPIDSSDCDYIMSVGLNILECNRMQVQIGDICLATGRCGTSFELNNCPNDQDFYIRVESSMCDGYLGGNGVINPATTETQTAFPTHSPASIPIPITENALSESLSTPSPSPISGTPATNTTDKVEDSPDIIDDTNIMSDFTDQNVDNDKAFKEGPENFIEKWRDQASSSLQTQAITLLSIGHGIIFFINTL